MDRYRFCYHKRYRLRVINGDCPAGWGAVDSAALFCLTSVQRLIEVRRGRVYAVRYVLDIRLAVVASSITRNDFLGKSFSETRAVRLVPYRAEVSDLCSERKQPLAVRVLAK